MALALLLAVPAQAQRVNSDVQARYERGERLTDEELRLLLSQDTWQTLQGTRGVQAHVPVGAPSGAPALQGVDAPEGRSAFYTVTTGIPNGFVDIAATGTAGPTGDSGFSSSAITFPSGFTFQLYGTAKTGFKISTDGYITFNTALTSTTLTNTTLPSSGNPNDLIAALWDDLVVPTTAPVGQTDHQLYDPGTPGDPTDDRYIIQWTDAYFYNTTTARATFQIQLFQNGNIEIYHNLLTTPQTDYTIGIENSGGTVGDLVYFDGTGTPASTATGIRFTYIPPPPPSCTTLTTPPNGATNVSYGFTSFAWAAEPVATGYLFDLGTTPGGNQVFNGLNLGNVTSVSVTGLTPTSTYYWTIRPYNGGGTASGCTEFSFMTAGPTTSFPLVESFTGTTFPPANWTRFNNGIGTAQSWVRNSASPIFAQSLFENVTSSVAQDYLATPALVSPAGGLNLTFKMWQSFSTTYNSVYKVLVSTNRQAVISDYTVLASWNETTACPGGTGAPPTAAPTSQNCSLSLAAYAGQTIYVAFLHENDDGDNFNLDDVTFTEIPSVPVFTLSPSGTFTFGTTGACTATTSRSQTFTVTNTGAGTLQVTNIALGGGTASAYSITSAPNFPVNLTAGQSTSVTVTFAPAVGETGVLTGSLEVTYDLDAGAQTATVSLSGTADASNFAVSSPATNTAGIPFRNSNAVCTVGSMVTAPGTALVPFTGHTRITTLSGGDFDDGYFDVDAATLDGLIADGSFRLFGQTFEALRITTNGNVLFNPPTYNAVNDRNVSLPTSLLGTPVAAAAMDLDTRAATYAADDDGIGGLPGIWYGTADVDADGDSEMVVTYYHAYDFGSVSYPSPSAAFFTYQAILFDAGDQPNREDRVEVRFFDGLDANGIPFRQNTATAIEPDVAIGLSNPQGTASSEYRDNSASGGPLYGSDLGVRFEAEVQAVADEPVPGWRMMGAPVTAYDVARLARLNLVTGVTGQYPDTTANVRIDYDGIEYVLATDVAQALVPGQGFMWYLYDQNFTPDPTSYGGGTSVSYALPMELEGTGAEVALTGGNYSIPLITDGKKWNLIANPFRQSLDLSGLSAWAVGGPLASAVGEIWLPTNDPPNFGTYILTTDPTVNNVITAWQGLLVENESATGLSVPGTARTTGGSFVGREGGAPPPENTRVLAFRLSAGDAGGPLLDRAALLYFHPDAREGWDLWDASKLAPLSDASATIAFSGARDGETVAKAQESRPFESGPFEVPMQFTATGMSGTFTLSWPYLQNLPEAWTLTLRDLVTGEEVDLRTAASYTFDASESAPAGLGGPFPTIGVLPRGTDRFVLSVGGSATANEPGVDLPTAFALQGTYPNPFSPRTTVRYAVPEASHVTLEVFDLLGRHVATLADAEARPGYHAAVWEAADFASGVYVVRMHSDTGFTQTQRVTLLK